MNSKLLVFLACAMLVVSVSSMRIRSWDDLEKYEEYEKVRPDFRNVKRGCTDSESSSFCVDVQRKNECGKTNLRMQCRKTCGNCESCTDIESSTFCKKVRGDNQCGESNLRSKCKKSCGSC